MTDPKPERPAARWTPLNEVQRRVLGVLIEKAKTVPAAYPMSVNAIVAGCNQKNNRDPVMTLDDFGVEKALDELRNLGAVSEVDWVGRVPKYKHHAYEWLGVDKPEIAVLAELLLRGAQALGELRGRAARMEPIADLAALKPIVTGLVERGLMIELTPAGRGQVVSHNLYLPPELDALRARFAGHPGTAEPSASGAEAGARTAQTGPGSGPAVADAEGPSAGIAELRAEVERLRERIAALEARMAEPPG